LELADRYADTIANKMPTTSRRCEAFASGSGFSLAEIVALNIRYEILYYRFGKIALAAGVEPEPKPDGCTAFALFAGATESGHLLMGQNWDWIPDVQGGGRATTDADGFETLGLPRRDRRDKDRPDTAGIGIGINGMTTVDDEMRRMAKPFPRAVLRNPAFADAWLTR
jgi:isopenicillin-N N-acyltransferase-like protein